MPVMGLGYLTPRVERADHPEFDVVRIFLDRSREGLTVLLAILVAGGSSGLGTEGWESGLPR